MDLYAGQPPVLGFIHDNPGCTQNEIADFLSVTPASIAFSTKRMQKSGLIQKQVNASDMRCNRLYLTPKGQEVLESFGEEYVRINESVFKGFTETEVDYLIDLFTRLGTNLEDILNDKEQ